MSTASPTELPARPTLTSLPVVGGVIAAALVVLSAYAGSDVAAYAVLAAGLVFAWGWPLLLGLPRPTGSSVVLAAAAVGMAGVVVFSGQNDGMQAISVVLAVGLVLAFLHELVRTDGRQSLTLSLAGCAFGLVVLASGMFCAGAAPYDLGDAAVAVTVGAPALGLIADALLPARHEREWSLPASLLIGVVLGLIVSADAGGSWNVLLLAGLVAGVIGAAIRRALRQLEGDDPAGRLSYGVASVLVAGALAYAAQWFINR